MPVSRGCSSCFGLAADVADERLHRAGCHEIERGVHFNLARLLALPLIGPLEARRFAQAQSWVAQAVLAGLTGNPAYPNPSVDPAESRVVCRA